MTFMQRVETDLEEHNISCSSTISAVESTISIFTGSHVTYHRPIREQELSMKSNNIRYHLGLKPV